jgi:YihY family inner membrane protein
MDPRAPVRAFDRFQRRHTPLAFVIAVLRNFSDQQAGNSVVLIAYYAFLSIFPLLLVFISILGFILQGDPSARATIVNSALRQFPIIGASVGKLDGSGVGLGVGLLGTLWSGLAITLAVESAFSRIYGIPPREQANFFVARWRGLKLLVVVGILQVLATVAAGAVAGGFGGSLLTAAGIVVALVLDLVLFFVVFRFLIPAVVPTRQLWPGVVIAAIGWDVLQSLGGLYIGHVVKGASQTYGTFATVIGLLAWLYLGARIVMYAAEINVVLERRLWPRSILDPPEPADRAAHALAARSLRTPSIEELIRAMDGFVAEADASPQARAMALGWLATAATALHGGEPSGDDDARAAIAVLVAAAQQALRGGERPAVPA